jgi:hypothetical protein
VPDHDRHSEPPEQLLVGADRPRPLPPYLRARLQELLSAAAVGDDEVSRPLSGQARDKLQNSLKPAQVGRPRKWVRLAPALGAAAAIVLALAVGIPALVHGPRTGPTGSFTENAAAPPAAGTHLPPERSALGAVPAPTKGAAGPKALRPAEGASIAAQAPPVASTARPGPASTVPLVGAVSPRTGPAGGGNWVVVRGAGFGSVTAVYFGNVAATMLPVVSAEQLRALAPAHAVGTVDVVASGPHGGSKVSVADHYSFVG